MTLLQGVVGSTAYGLARDGSDVDRLGVFVAPTVEVSGLHWSPDRESTVTTNPDVTLHEVGKFLRLALKCNPSVTELLWLPKRHLEVVEPIYGETLIGLRRSLLSAPAVRNAYGEYARQQADKLRRRGDGSFSSDTRKRTAKHARHILRLLRQGRQLLRAQHLTVEVTDPEEYWEFDDMTSEQMLEVYAHEHMLFHATETELPDRPDYAQVRSYLANVRSRYMWGE